MERTEQTLYRLGLAVFVAAAVMGVLYQVTGFSLLALQQGCLFNKVTGLYCPGCGGTRAVQALSRGQFGRSFYYHPLVLYSVTVCGWYMVSHTVQKVTRGSVRIAMRYRDIYVWLALVVLGGNFFIKNLMLLVWNIRMI